MTGQLLKQRRGELLKTLKYENTEELTETLTRGSDPRAHSPAASLHTDARSRALMKARAGRGCVLRAPANQ